MPLTEVRNQLWTPDGGVPLQAKDVKIISRREIIALSILHGLAHRFGWTLTCKRCDSAITGANNGHERRAAVACKCQEFLYPGD